MVNYRALSIRYLLPVVWAFSKKRKTAALQEFSLTELDSGWHSLYALQFVNNSQDKALLFQHALEEWAHSDHFADLCQQYSEQPLSILSRSRKVLLTGPNPDSLLDFFCYMYVGESAVNADFKHYRRSKIDSKIANLFNKIEKDEEGHESDSLRLVQQFSNGDTDKINKYLYYNQGKHRNKVIFNFLNKIMELILSTGLSFLYFIIGLFYTVIFKRRLNFTTAQQMTILKAQVSHFEQLHAGRPKA